MKSSNYLRLYQDSLKQFLFSRRELERVFLTLESYQKISLLENKKVGIYKHLKKLIPCFDVLLNVSRTNSLQSVITLFRMIVDNYAILYLFTNFSSTNEQLLRYYLYLLDAVNSRPKIIKDFSVNIKYKVPEETYRDANNAILFDNKSSTELLKIINQKQLNSLVNEKIIDTSNWKYKDAKEINQNSNRYKWIELYAISRIPKHHAQMIQEYHSSFVHGLGISLMSENDDNVIILLISVLDFCTIIMSLMIKIITTEYKEETNNVLLNQKINDFINDIWNNWN